MTAITTHIRKTVKSNTGDLVASFDAARYATNFDAVNLARPTDLFEDRIAEYDREMLKSFHAHLRTHPKHYDGVECRHCGHTWTPKHPSYIRRHLRNEHDVEIGATFDAATMARRMNRIMRAASTVRRALTWEAQ